MCGLLFVFFRSFSLRPSRGFFSIIIIESIAKSEIQICDDEVTVHGSSVGAQLCAMDDRKYSTLVPYEFTVHKHENRYERCMEVKREEEEEDGKTENGCNE